MALSANHVLAPIDLSEVSLLALETAAQAVADGGQLTVLYVLERLPDTAPSVLLGTVNDEERAAHVDARVRAALDARRIYARVEVVRDADAPSIAITDWARHHGVDMIVIGSHGRTGIARLALGSVAERVVRLSPCPVLVIRR